MIVSDGGPTSIERLEVLETAGDSESVTLIVKLEVPAAVGVPLMRPFETLRVKPAGRLPAVIDQE